MIEMYGSRLLSDKQILQKFLMEFHIRQSESLRNKLKVVSNQSWVSGSQLFVTISNYIGRKNCIEQFSQEVIIPFTDEMLRRIEIEADDCDAIIFHKLPLPSYYNCCMETLDNVTARIVTATKFGVYPTDVTRIDVAFTPVWLKPTSKDCLWYVGRD